MTPAQIAAELRRLAAENAAHGLTEGHAYINLCWFLQSHIPDFIAALEAHSP